jgi:hypothetical protein
MCAYAIDLKLHEYTAIAAQVGPEIDVIPPRYIPSDVDYVDGLIGKDEEHYYYLPYSETDGDMMIMLNKTNPIGKGAQMSLSMNIYPHGEKEYKQWNLPGHGSNKR